MVRSTGCQVVDGTSSTSTKLWRDLLDPQSSLLVVGIEDRVLATLHSTPEILNLAVKLKLLSFWLESRSLAKLAEDVFVLGEKRALRELTKPDAARFILLAGLAKGYIHFDKYGELIELHSTLFGADLIVIEKLAKAATTVQSQESFGEYLSYVIGAYKAVGKLQLGKELAARYLTSKALPPLILASLASADAQLYLAENQAAAAMNLFRQVVRLAPNNRVSALAYYWLIFDATGKNQAVKATKYLTQFKKSLPLTSAFEQRMLNLKAGILRANVQSSTKKVTK